MDNDIWGRTISVDTADGIDTYTVYESDDNVTIYVPFPTGTDLSYVYEVINQIYPGNSDLAYPDYSYYQSYSPIPWAAGPTINRPPCESWMYGGMGFMFFDQTLGKPIWFVGYGTTGWVDATGAQV